MSVELYARILKSWHIKTPPWKADQKQPPEVFYKKSCSKTFGNIHRKTPTLESLLNRVTCLKTCNVIKKRLQRRLFSSEYCEIFRNTYFEEHMLQADPMILSLLLIKLKGYCLQLFAKTELYHTSFKKALFGSFKNFQNNCLTVYFWMIFLIHF